MIVARFKVRCRPECTEQMGAAIAAVETPSRRIPGVAHFDAARSLTDPDTFVVIEVSQYRRRARSADRLPPPGDVQLGAGEEFEQARMSGTGVVEEKLLRGSLMAGRD
jgi:hypothetical protein